MQAKSVRTIKCVAVGDRVFGKCYPPFPYSSKRSPLRYQLGMPFENYTATFRIGDQPYKLNLFYAPGGDDLDAIRPFWYPNADVFLVCFSVIDPISIDNVQKKWLPEIERHTQNRTPILLVGSQIECREEQAASSVRRRLKVPLSTARGEKMARKLKAVKYLECSTVTEVGLRSVLDEAVLAAVYPPKPVPVEKRKFKLFKQCYGGGPSKGRKCVYSPITDIM